MPTIDVNEGLEKYKKMVNQTPVVAESDVDSRLERYKLLNDRKGKLERNVDKINAELAVCRRDLKRYMEECKTAGFDPNNLKEEIRKRLEILDIKLDTFETDVKAGEEQILPMLDEIQRG